MRIVYFVETFEPYSNPNALGNRGSFLTWEFETELRARAFIAEFQANHASASAELYAESRVYRTDYQSREHFAPPLAITAIRAAHRVYTEENPECPSS